MIALSRRPTFLLLASPKGPDDDSRNPYPPRRESSPSPTGLTPPHWFLRYWPVTLTVVSFLAGLWFLNRDLSDGAIEVVPAIIYMTLMGYLPIAALAGLLKR